MGKLKGIIKGVNQTSGGTSITVISVEADGSSTSTSSTSAVTTPAGDTYTGTIEAIASGSTSGKIIKFIQPFGAELGLTKDAKVTFDSVNDPVTGEEIAVAVSLIEKGVILTLDDASGSGTLKDRASGATLEFFQPYASLLGIKAPAAGVKGSVVTFTRIIDPKTSMYRAVALELVK